MPYVNLEVRKKYQFEYRAKHREKNRLYAIQYKKDNAEEIKKSRNEKNKRRPFYTKLRRIIQRCNDKNSRDYKWYGGKGVKCKIIEADLRLLWLRDRAYLMKKPSIDRLDDDGDYSLENCRFVEHNKNCSEAQIRRWNRYRENKKEK